MGPGILREHDGLDEVMVRESIRTHEEHAKKEEQIQFNWQDEHLAGPTPPYKAASSHYPLGG